MVASDWVERRHAEETRSRLGTDQQTSWFSAVDRPRRAESISERTPISGTPHPCLCV